MDRGIIHQLRAFRLRRYVLLLASIWTVLVGGSLFWNIRQDLLEIYELAIAEARGAFNKDLAYRRWASGHGGVYVAVTEGQPPNPYLSHIEERDITTPSGNQLTLINPAYMTRQVHELSVDQYGLRGHITSLKPINPVNIPDQWESEALMRFEDGETEITSIMIIDGTEYMRLMNPMITEESCLKCHSHQGYEVGDVRGGISVSVPMETYRAIERKHRSSLVLGHSLLWLIGLLGVGLGSQRLGKRIRERETAEDALRRSDTKYQDLFNSAPIAYFSINTDGWIVEANAAALKLLGFQLEELQEIHYLDLYADESKAKAARLFEMFRQGHPWDNEEMVLVRRDENQIHGLLSMNPIKDENDQVMESRTVVVDMTDRRRLEEQLTQSQKMEAIGRLAGGIAHDFNNLLTVINGNVQLSLPTLSLDNPVHNRLLTIQKAGLHAAELTSKLLSFSRKQIITPRVLDFDGVLAEILPLLRRVIGEDIELVTRHGKSGTCVKVDPGQIEQVVMNLVVNAREAMPDGGNLTIETSVVILDETYLATHPYAQRGPHVMLAVSDTGCGMDEQTCKKIFEPFFTTKDTGTGLGLATVYGILKQHHGSIEIYSEVGLGSTFRIYLPVVDAQPETYTHIEESTEIVEGTETILLVEDNDEVRNLALEILKGAGYTVHTCANAEEAERFCEAFGGIVDLLLTDVVMPGKSGIILSESVKPFQPAIRTLFMTGYARGVIAAQGVLEEGMDVIIKPFTPTQLSERVRQAIDRK